MALSFVTTKEVEKFREKNGLSPDVKLTKDQFEQIISERKDSKSTLRARLARHSADNTTKNINRSR